MGRDKGNSGDLLKKVKDYLNSDESKGFMKLWNKVLAYDALGFWKGKNLVFQLDTFQYVDETKLSQENRRVDLSKLLKKYPYHQVREFENKEYWYILKFFFMASYLEPISDSYQLLAGIPRGIKIKCTCDTLLGEAWFLEGFFSLPDLNYRHHYYLRISKECKKCGSIICIYRHNTLNTKSFCRPLRIFMNFVRPYWRYNIEHYDMFDMWKHIFKQATLFNTEEIQSRYRDDIFKFRSFLQRVEKKHKKMMNSK